MSLTVCTKICKERPFSKSSPRGWLGSHTLEGVLTAQTESKLFSCHLQRKDGMTNDDIASGEIKICRGYLLSSSKSDITFAHDAKTGDELRKLQILVENENQEDINTILSRQELKEHHAGPSASDKIPVSQEIINQRRGSK